MKSLHPVMKSSWHLVFYKPQSDISVRNNITKSQKKEDQQHKPQAQKSEGTTVTWLKQWVAWTKKWWWCEDQDQQGGSSCCDDVSLDLPTHRIKPQSCKRTQTYRTWTSAHAGSFHSDGQKKLAAWTCVDAADRALTHRRGDNFSSL